MLLNTTKEAISAAHDAVVQSKDKLQFSSDNSSSSSSTGTNVKVHTRFKYEVPSSNYSEKQFPINTIVEVLYNNERSPAKIIEHEESGVKVSFHCGGETCLIPKEDVLHEIRNVEATCNLHAIEKLHTYEYATCQCA